MQNEHNSSHTKLEMLDKYLDGQLSGEQMNQLQEELQQNPALQRELEILQLSRDAVRSKALVKRVHTMHHQYIKEIKSERSVPTKSVSFPSYNFKWIWRVAAVLLIGFLGYGAFQFISINTETLYQQKFMSYQFPLTRSESETFTTIDSLYLDRNFSQIPQAFSALSAKSRRDYFLTAMAHMEQQQYEQAVELFEQLQQLNTQSPARDFEQEIDYYLSLAYLHTGQNEKARALFKKMLDDPSHVYHDNITRQDVWKLNVLELKQ